MVIFTFSDHRRGKWFSNRDRFTILASWIIFHSALNYDESNMSARSQSSGRSSGVHGSILCAPRIQPGTVIPPIFLHRGHGSVSRLIPSVNWDGFDYKFHHSGSQLNSERSGHLLHVLQCKASLFKEEYCNPGTQKMTFLEDFGPNP